MAMHAPRHGDIEGDGRSRGAAASALQSALLALGARALRAGTGPREGGWLVQRARALLIRYGDPLVRYRLDGIDLELPLSHELPHYRSVYPDYGANLGRLARAVAEAHPGRGIVDVGANVGDSAACVRATCAAPVLCIEGEERFFDVLSRNARRMPGLTLERALVGAADAAVSGRLHARRGTARALPGDGELRYERLDAILARHPGFPAPKLVKSDTDGDDFAILSGHLDLWARLRPVLFFEYDPAFASAGFDPPAFFEAFVALGYDRLLAWENVGEYLCSFSLRDRAALLDLHARYEGWGSHRYADVALFHADDADVAERVRRGEHEHARRRRVSGTARAVQANA